MRWGLLLDAALAQLSVIVFVIFCLQCQVKTRSRDDDSCCVLLLCLLNDVYCTLSGTGCNSSEMAVLSLMMHAKVPASCSTHRQDTVPCCGWALLNLATAMLSLLVQARLSPSCGTHRRDTVPYSMAGIVGWQQWLCCFGQQQCCLLRHLRQKY